MTQLGGVTNTQNTQVWNAAAQHKPVVSQDMFASTLSRAGEFSDKKEGSSCISSFFGCIFDAISAFFRTLFCLDCCYGSKLNVTVVKAQNEDGAEIRRYETTSGDETHALDLKIHEKTDDKAAFAYIDKDEITENSSSFMNALVNELKGKLENIIFAASSQSLAAARKMYGFDFNPEIKDGLVFNYKTYGVGNSSDVDKIKDVEEGINEAIKALEKRESSELNKDDVVLLGKLVAALTGKPAKETLVEVKEVWTAAGNKCVKWYPTLAAKDAVELALVFGEVFDSLVKTDQLDQFNMKFVFTKSE